VNQAAQKRCFHFTALQQIFILTGYIYTHPPQAIGQPKRKRKKIIHLKHLHIYAQNKCNHLEFSLKQILLITPSIAMYCGTGTRN